LYPHLIDTTVEIKDGAIALSERSGIGVRWLDELFDSSAKGYRLSGKL
jgi:hypothetical protein